MSRHPIRILSGYHNHKFENWIIHRRVSYFYNETENVAAIPTTRLHVSSLSLLSSGIARICRGLVQVYRDISQIDRLFWFHSVQSEFCDHKRAPGVFRLGPGFVAERIFHTHVKRARACTDADVAVAGMNDIKFNAANLSRRAPQPRWRAVHPHPCRAYTRERMLKVNSHLRLYVDEVLRPPWYHSVIGWNFD